jgi:hypothetical protein
MINLGTVQEGATVTIPISHNLGTGAAGSFATPLVVADMDVYNASGAINITQRNSTAGFAVDDTFDGVTGLTVFTIDLSDDTDPGFYSTGNSYVVSLTPTATLDGVVVAAWVAYFTIESVSQRAARTFNDAVFVTDTVVTTTSNTTTAINLTDFLDAQAPDNSTTGELWLWQDSTGELEYFRVQSMTSLVATVEAWPAGGALSAAVAASDKLWRVGYVDVNTAAINDQQITGDGGTGTEFQGARRLGR